MMCGVVVIQKHCLLTIHFDVGFVCNIQGLCSRTGTGASIGPC